MTLEGTGRVRQVNSLEFAVNPAGGNVQMNRSSQRAADNNRQALGTSGTDAASSWMRPWRTSRRQRKIRLGEIRYRRATRLALEPGCQDSLTIRNFSAAVHCRR